MEPSRSTFVKTSLRSAASAGHSPNVTQASMAGDSLLQACSALPPTKVAVTPPASHGSDFILLVLPTWMAQPLLQQGMIAAAPTDLLPNAMASLQQQQQQPAGHFGSRAPSSNASVDDWFPSVKARTLEDIDLDFDVADLGLDPESFEDFLTEEIAPRQTVPQTSPAAEEPQPVVVPVHSIPAVKKMKDGEQEQVDLSP
jgi:hypothetical protein